MENRFLSLIEDGIRNNWEHPALSDYNGEVYLYKDFATKIAELHLLFDILKIEKGDKIALCGRNSANWAIIFFASLSYGAVVTTILHDFNSENIHNIVNHSEAKILFSGEFVWDKIDPSEMPIVQTIFMIDDFSILKSSSEELLAARSFWGVTFAKKYPKGFSRDDLNFHVEQPEELAVLNYTSGTTSNPKGVMIPYRSLWSNTRFAIDEIPFVKAGDGVVCMLPMAHMYGLAFEILLSVAKGCHVNFLTRVPSPQIIMDAFAKVKPTIILAVPLIIEKIIRNKVFVELDKQPTKSLLKIPVLKDIVYKKVLNQLLVTFGGKLEEVVIGGAALNKEVGDFLTKIKFPYTVGYGMTECGPLITYAYWTDYIAGSCGKAVDRMSIAIDSSSPDVAGEILVKGDNIMLGYLKNPEATAAVLTKDGWLKTGDLGVVDKDGNVYIKGRNKTMILGASGQNIYPEEIEDLLNNSFYVAESLVVEDSGKLVALIYPDYDFLEKNHIKATAFKSLFDQEIKSINKRLPTYSKISQFKLRDKEFEKTPKRSIRRFLYQN